MAGTFLGTFLPKFYIRMPKKSLASKTCYLENDLVTISGTVLQRQYQDKIAFGTRKSNALF